MNALRLSDIIGQEITALRYQYEPRNEYDLQTFYAYLKLSSGTIIGIPHFDDVEYLQLTKERVDYLHNCFDTGRPVSEKANHCCEGQKIMDFYFSYYKGEIDTDFPAIIKMSNGLYITENNSGPLGVTDIDLHIFDEVQFKAEVKRRNGFEVDVRSFMEKE